MLQLITNLIKQMVVKGIKVYYNYTKIIIILKGAIESSIITDRYCTIFKYI